MDKKDLSQQNPCRGAYSNIVNIFKNTIENMRSDVQNPEKGELITINNVSAVLSQLQNMLNNTLSNLGYEVTITMSTLNESHLHKEEIEYKELNQELNVFSGAKFGTKYVTRNGDIALYLCDCILVVAGTVTPMSYNQRGVAIGKDKGYDIVGKYNLWYKIRKYLSLGK